MIKLKYVIFLLIFFLCGCSNSEIEQKSNTDKNSSYDIDANLLNQNIKNITSTTRVIGSEGETKCSQFITTTLESYGYNVSVQEFPVYKQDRAFLESDYENFNPFNSDPIANSKNIIAKQGNFDSNKKTLYLTAHYDSDKNTIGVIDNATGVSSVLEIARLLKSKELPFNIQIVLFSAEECGIYGSKYFVSNLSKKEKSNTIGTINLDMIGEKNAGKIIIKTSLGRNNVISLMLNDSLDTKLEVLPGSTSDEYSFYRGELPSVTLANEHSKTFTGNNQFDFLDINQLEETTKLVFDFIDNFNMTTYNSFLSEKKEYDLKENDIKIPKLEDYKLVSVKEKLFDNGFDSFTIFTYLDKKNNKYTLIERDSRFISKNKYTDFKVLEEENNYLYKIINKDTSSDTKLAYKWGYTDGKIISKSSLDNCLQFLDAYYISFYEDIFGYKPPLSILN